MIEINLLPKEYRKKKINFLEIIQQYKNLFIPVAGVVAAVIAIILLMMLVYPKWQERTLRRLDGRWKVIEKDYKEVVELKKAEKELKDKLNSIDYIISNTLSWAAKLNEISDAMPPEIQLTEMIVKPEEDKDGQLKEVLLISGVVPQVPGERAIEEFIKSLKDDSSFTRDFPQIELPYTETTESGLKNFMLRCYLDNRFLFQEEEKEKTDKKKTGRKTKK